MDIQEGDSGIQLSTGTASSMREWHEPSEPWSMRSWTYATSLD